MSGQTEPLPDTGRAQKRRTSVKWIGALGAMGVACVWWFASQRDAPQCSPKVLDALMAQATNVVSVSPDGRYVLAKERHPKDFEVKVFECQSGRLVACERAAESHLALSWRPDSQAFAFLAGKYGEFFPYLFDLKTGRRQKLNGPATASLRLSPRWTGSGDELAYVHVAGTKRSIITLTPDKPKVKPAVVCEEMALEGGFAFSPDATQMALVEKNSPTSVQIVSMHDDSRRGIEIVPQGQIRDLAWSPQQESLLVSARAEKSEYYELYLVDLNANSVRCVVSACGDVFSPVWLPSAKRFIYHLEEQGQTRAVLADFQTTHIRTLGPAEGMIAVQSEPVEDNKVFARHIGLDTAPRLLSIALDSGEAKEVFTPSPGEKVSFVAPQFVSIRAEDGKSFPSYVWRASQVPGQAPCALISVHGGPRLHEVPVWDAGVQLLAKAGIHVVTINYRGSSGYGRTFERQEVVSRQVQDIAAACRYATSELGVPPQRIILMGTSLGSFLACSACSAMANPPGGLVLVSSVAKAVAVNKEHRPKKVLAFHGEFDSTSPADARKALENTFGADDLEWRVFRKEGHAFHRGESWGEVYSSIVRLAQETLP